MDFLETLPGMKPEGWEGYGREVTEPGRGFVAGEEEIES